MMLDMLARAALGRAGHPPDPGRHHPGDGPVPGVPGLRPRSASIARAPGSRWSAPSSTASAARWRRTPAHPRRTHRPRPSGEPETGSRSKIASGRPSCSSESQPSAAAEGGVRASGVRRADGRPRHVLVGDRVVQVADDHVRRTRRRGRTGRSSCVISSRVRLDDPANPVVGPAVNAPGGLVAERASDGTGSPSSRSSNPGSSQRRHGEHPLPGRAVEPRLPAAAARAHRAAWPGRWPTATALFSPSMVELVAVEPFAAGGPRVRSAHRRSWTPSVSGDGGPLGVGLTPGISLVIRRCTHFRPTCTGR